MKLNAALNLIFDEYPKATLEEFAGNPIAEFIRKDLPETIQSVIGTNDRYLVQGSAGQGNWARVPWGAIFDRLVTDTAQDGYYLVYLFKEDFSGVYLSLNQGVTSIRKQYGSDSKHALRVRATDFLARLGKLAEGLHQGPIDLSVASQSSLGAFYEHGAICSIYYPKAKLPLDDKLSSDLLRCLDLYLALVSRETRLFERTDSEDDEENLGEEDLRSLRFKFYHRQFGILRFPEHQ